MVLLPRLNKRIYPLRQVLAEQKIELPKSNSIREAFALLKNRKDKDKIQGRLKSSQRILKKTLKTKYFPMILFLMFNQYLWQTWGYFARSRLR